MAKKSEELDPIPFLIEWSGWTNDTELFVELTVAELESRQMKTY